MRTRKLTWGLVNPQSPSGSPALYLGVVILKLQESILWCDITYRFEIPSYLSTNVRSLVDDLSVQVDPSSRCYERHSLRVHKYIIVERRPMYLPKELRYGLFCRRNRGSRVARSKFSFVVVDAACCTASRTHGSRFPRKGVPRIHDADIPHSQSSLVSQKIGRYSAEELHKAGALSAITLRTSRLLSHIPRRPPFPAAVSSVASRCR